MRYWHECLCQNHPIGIIKQYYSLNLIGRRAQQTDLFYIGSKQTNINIKALSMNDLLIQSHSDISSVNAKLLLLIPTRYGCVKLTDIKLSLNG